MFNGLLRGNRFRGSDGVYKPPDSDYSHIFYKNVGHRRRDASLVLRDHRVGDWVDARRFFRGKTFHAVPGSYVLTVVACFDPRSVSSNGSAGRFAGIEDANPTTILGPFACRGLDALF